MRECALLNQLAAGGWVCVSANYRLAPAYHFPAAHVDAERVISPPWSRYPERPGLPAGLRGREHLGRRGDRVHGYYGRVAGPSTLVEDTREFVTRLREASTQPVVYAELPGRPAHFRPVLLPALQPDHRGGRRVRPSLHGPAQR
jgi:alpha/beta hydrolase fold